MDRKQRRRYLLTAILIAVGFVLAGQAWARSAGTPIDLGLDERGNLRDCPNSTNCVSSTARSAGALIEPLTCSGVGGTSLLDRVINAFITDPSTVVESREVSYVHLISTSSFWGFRDDVELHLRGAVVEVRSQSRLGQGDLGVNEARVEAARMALASQC